MDGQIRVGIVGAGRWAASHHLPALTADPRVRVTCVADPQPAKCRLACEAFGIRGAFGSAAELYAAGLADAVVIAAPHAQHYELAAGALDAGLHVLIEKPLTLDPLDAWRLIHRAERGKLHLVVGYPFEFAWHAKQARRLVAGIGPIRLVSCLYASPRSHLYRRQPSRPPSLRRADAWTYADPASSGGGQGQTEVTHALACLLHATRLEVAEVTAQMRHASYPVDVVDTLLLRFRSGAIGTLASIGTVSPDHPPQRELRYYGDRGIVLHDLSAGTVTCQAEGAEPVTCRSRSEYDVYPTRAPARCLVDAVLGVGAVPVDTRIAAHTVACLSAAYRSASSGGQSTAVPGPEGPLAGVDDLERLGEPAWR
jgi:predicted dehydrogenase